MIAVIIGRQSESRRSVFAWRRYADFMKDEDWAMGSVMERTAQIEPLLAFDVKAFRAAATVQEPLAEAPDLEFVAEPDEIADLEWRLVEVNILDMYQPFDMDDRLTLSGETELQAAERWKSVRNWMTAAGGPLEAIKRSPVIAVHMGDRLVPLDGWHRCVVAWMDHGCRSVTALVGIEPLFEPDHTEPGM